MPYKATVYRVIISSPSDVEEERREIQNVIYAWNAIYSCDLQAVVLPVMWEEDTVPEMGEHPQTIINRQIVANSDILVGVFWTKLGTPTPQAASGSVEEIEKFHSDRKPVLLYFSEVPIPQGKIDSEQYAKLESYKQDWYKRGLASRYRSIDELGQNVQKHLYKTVLKLQGEDTTPTRDTEANAARTRLVDSLKCSQTPAFVAETIKNGDELELTNVGHTTATNVEISPVNMLFESLLPDANIIFESVVAVQPGEKVIVKHTSRFGDEPTGHGFALDWLFHFKQEYARGRVFPLKIKFQDIHGESYLQTVEMGAAGCKPGPVEMVAQ